LNQNRKHGIQLGPASQLPALFVVALFFFMGVILGQVLVGNVPDEVGWELSRYLSDFLQTCDWQTPVGARAFILTLGLYFRYPVVAFLLGFASVGVLLLPCATILFGLLLSFSVSCFTATFGAGGILLAAAVLGLRCAVTLPCYFLTAASALKSSAILASFSFGRGRRAAPGRYENWRSCGMMCVCLFFGACADVVLSPWFLRMALEHISL